MSTDPARARRDEADAQATPVVRFSQVGLARDGREPALRSLSFALAPGSFHLVTGPRGAGKTSLLRLIGLMERPTQGVAQVFGRDVATLSRREANLTRRRIGQVLYPLLFVDHLSVWENAALGPRVTGRRPGDYEREVDAVLKWLGLSKLADAFPGALPPAERHRLAIARAVVNRPEILLLDEPSEGLEPAAAERAVKLAGELHAAGATVVMTVRDDTVQGRPVIHLQEGRASLLEPEQL